MTNILDATEKFMEAAGQLEESYFPLDYDHPLRTLRRELSKEENREYRDGEYMDDPAEIADGLIDQIVVHWGTLCAYFGPDLAKKLAASVGDSNLSKVVDGKVIKREDGKILKPEGYFKPRIKEILEEEGFVSCPR